MTEKHTWNKVNQWSEELGKLREIVHKTELIETQKWGVEVYTVNNKNVLGLAGFKNYFTIWFFNGVFLKDANDVLVNANKGITKALRQWRFTSINEIDEKLILKYIHEAIANEKAGLSIKPEKKETMNCEFFEEELNSNSELKEALKKFTPFKQKEFWEYMATAKQEKTKRTRLEKIRRLIMENKGLNDKYR